MGPSIEPAPPAASLTTFKRQTSALLERLRATGQPMVLTVRGKAEVVVQDAAAYQRLLETVDRLEAVVALREGLEEMEAGRGRPAGEVLEEIRSEHQIPRDV